MQGKKCVTYVAIQHNIETTLRYTGEGIMNKKLMKKCFGKKEEIKQSLTTKSSANVFCHSLDGMTFDSAEIMH